MSSHGIKDRVAIVGMGCTNFVEHWDQGLDDLVIDAANDAYASAGIEKDKVDAYWLGTAQGGMSGITLARPLQLVDKPVTRVENFCATGSEALRQAAYAVASGAYDVAMAVGVEKTKDGGFQGLNAVPPPNDGTGLVQATSTDPTATATTSLELGLAAGLQIRNGNQTYTLDLSAAETVQDLLNLLNGSSAGVLATLNESGSGIDVRSRLSGADFGLGENGGSLASFLGIRSLTGETRLDELNHGLGVQAVNGPDFRITRSDGTSFDVPGTVLRITAGNQVQMGDVALGFVAGDVPELNALSMPFSCTSIDKFYDKAVPAISPVVSQVLLTKFKVDPIMHWAMPPQQLWLAKPVAGIEGLRNLHSAEEISARRGVRLRSVISGQPASQPTEVAADAR